MCLRVRNRSVLTCCLYCYPVFKSQKQKCTYLLFVLLPSDILYFYSEVTFYRCYCYREKTRWCSCHLFYFVLFNVLFILWSQPNPVLMIGLVCLMVFNATFNNISVTSWLSVLLMQERGVPGEYHLPVANYWQTLSHNVVSSTPRHERCSNSKL